MAPVWGWSSWAKVIERTSAATAPALAASLAPEGQHGLAPPLDRALGALRASQALGCARAQLREQRVGLRIREPLGLQLGKIDGAARALRVAGEWRGGLGRVRRVRRTGAAE